MISSFDDAFLIKYSHTFKYGVTTSSDMELPLFDEFFINFWLLSISICWYVYHAIAIYKEEMNFGGKKLILETGKIARQAAGSVMVTYGGTQVLCTCLLYTSDAADE